MHRSPARGTGIPLTDVVVLGLAAARLARAVSVDEIGQPLRDRVNERTDGNVNRWATTLVNCPVCTGWWFSLLVSLVAPGRHRLLRGVAVAGVQVLVSLLERLVSEEGRAAIHEADRAAAVAEAVGGG